MALADYEIRVIKDKTSFTPVVLQNAIPGKFYRELNNWGTFEFTISTTDAQVSEVELLEREVQLWRNGSCRWWGVMVSARADKDWLQVQCYGLEWYFSRRLFGPIQTNYLTNGGFESGLSGWTTVGCTSAIDTSWKVRGSQSVKLTTSASGTDAYIGRFDTVTAHPDQAVAFKASGVYRINPTATWNGPAIYERGLYLARLVDGVIQGDDFLWEPITEDVLRDGSEVFVETPDAVTVPAGQTQTLELRAYGPSSEINWDELKIVVEESVSTPIAGEDVATLIQRVVDYAQHGTGKSDLNIGFAYTSTGKHLSLRAYQFFDHGNIWESFSEFVDASVCDIGVTWNANGTQRTFNVWGWPGRGSLKTDLRLDLDPGGKIADMQFEVDGTQTANKVRALGLGTGSTREVGEATDTSSTGGVVFESSINVPIETLVGALDGLASAELSRTKAPVKVPKFTTHENAGSVIDNLDLGDLVPVVLNFGWVQENDTRRVVGILIDPATDTVEPTVNV